MGWEKILDQVLGTPKARGFEVSDLSAFVKSLLFLGFLFLLSLRQNVLVIYQLTMGSTSASLSNSS